MMSRLALSAFVALITIVIAAPARAALIQHAPSGLRIDTSSAGAPICVLSPASLREPSACEGVGNRVPSMPPAAVAVALVRIGATGMPMIVVAAPANEPLTLGSAGSYTQGMAEGIREWVPDAQLRRFPSGLDYETSTLHGAHVLHCVATSQAGAQWGVPLVVHAWTFDAAGYYVSFSLIGPAADEAQVLAVGRALVAATSVTPRPGPLEWQTAEGSKAYRLGYIISRVLGWVTLVVAAVIVAWRLSTRAKDSSTPR